MKKITSIITIFVLGWIATSAYAGEYDFKPGLWETTTNVTFTGLSPQFAKMMEQKPFTEQYCMSEKDLFMNSENDCKYTRKRVSSRLLKVSMSCNSQNGNATGKGEIHFNGRKVSGWFEMQGRGPNGPMTTRNNFTSKYIGACKE